MTRNNLSADTVRNEYHGKKASTYDVGRACEAKWLAEQSVVDSYLAQELEYSSVLDIPVGTGRFIPLYKHYNMYMHGVDTSSSMLEQAQRKAKELEYTKGLFRIGNIFDLKNIYDSCVYDISICVRLLNFFTEDELCKALKGLFHVSKRTVILSLRTGNPSTSSNRCNVHHIDTLMDIAEKCSFILDSSFLVGKDNYRIFKLTSKDDFTCL